MPCTALASRANQGAPSLKKRLTPPKPGFSPSGQCQASRMNSANAAAAFG